VNSAAGVLAVGELIADIVVVDERTDNARALRPRGDASDRTLHLIARPGGSPANVAVGLARLGVAASFAGRLSSVGVGPWLAGYLASNGVDTGFSVKASEAPTLAVVSLDSAGVPSYRFYGADTADWHWRREELPTPERLAVAALHTGSLATTTPPGCQALASWVADIHAGGAVLVSYDPNVRVSRLSAPAALAAQVDSWVRRADLVKVSQDDLAVLHPGTDATAIARGWAGLGPELVVLTLGAEGSMAFRPDGSTVASPAPPVQVVDTVGAGDAFCAGLLAWLSEAGALHPGGPSRLSAGDLRSALNVASQVAGVTCSRPGADPPGRAEVTAAPWP
jgi:fructokinase